MTGKDSVLRQAISLDSESVENTSTTRSRLDELSADLLVAVDRLSDTPFSDCFPTIIFFSDFFHRICRRYPDQVIDLIDSGDLVTHYTDGIWQMKSEKLKFDHQQGDDLDMLLRRSRHIEMIRIMWRELSGVTDTEQTIIDLSALADNCLQIAVDTHFSRLKIKYGEPVCNQTDRNAQFCVFGLGKLGGKELNFSSDIDLVFAFSENGSTQGEKEISNNEFFIKLGQSVINALNIVTDDGQAYRVDMRLRPNGQSGPLAMSFSAMENYYQIHGRGWERYAWIKARTVAGDKNEGQAFLEQLRPFVYRKYLDYQVYESLEEMKSMINKEIRLEGMKQNIKLGQGGIREIEFIVQSHQLVRGGRDPKLRTGSLKRALFSLAKSQQIDADVAISLYDAYLYLRSVEHRIQMINDQQTHQIPTDKNKLKLIAASMGEVRSDFENNLHRHREFVEYEFARFQSHKAEPEIDENWQVLWGRVVNNQASDSEIDDRFSTLNGYVASKSYRSLESRGRKIMDKLMPKVLSFIDKQPESVQALNRTLDVLTSIGGRVAYLSLLDQFPVALKQLVMLCGASSWVSRWIADHPIVLDTLINPRTDLYSFNDDIEQLIETQITNEPDDELKHDILRQIHHSCILQIAMADLQSQYSAAELRNKIANVAQSIINQVVRLCQRELEPRFGMPLVNDGKSAFGVIAYGKLGSSELSYNADLDLVFIFNDSVIQDETAGGVKSVRCDYYYSRLVQRILTMLSMQTSAGKLYDVDTRLRPSGRSGLLVSSLTQYKKYQLEKAWLWEHQALVKARLITHDLNLEAQFEGIREQVLCIKRDQGELIEEITDMRKRMHNANGESTLNYKTQPGGMIDIEFISQFIVLRFACQYKAICRHRSVVNILEFAKSHSLIEAKDADSLIEAYQTILQIENKYKLNAIIDESKNRELNKQIVSVKDVWFRLFD